jgi:hypothetical protein
MLDDRRLLPFPNGVELAARLEGRVPLCALGINSGLSNPAYMVLLITPRHSGAAIYGENDVGYRERDQQHEKPDWRNRGWRQCPPWSNDPALSAGAQRHSGNLNRQRPGPDGHSQPDLSAGPDKLILAPQTAAKPLQEVAPASGPFRSCWPAFFNLIQQEIVFDTRKRAP